MWFAGMSLEEFTYVRSSGHSYQADSPMGLDLKLLKRAPNDPLGIVPEGLM